MAETSSVVLTGATGFLGPFLIRALLAQGKRVVALARGGKERSDDGAAQRVADGLSALGLTRPTTGELKCFDFDLGRPDLGLSSDGRRFVESLDRPVVLHGAADVRHLPRWRSEIEATNIDGTRHVLAFSHELAARRVIYISSSAVGLIANAGDPRPERYFADVSPTNEYDRTKWEAERLVEAAGGWTARVPPLSAPFERAESTGRAAYFGLIFAVFAAREVAPSAEVIRLPGLPAAKVQLGPVDWAANVLAGLVGVESAPAHGVLHCVSDEGHTLQEHLDWIGDVLDYWALRVVPPQQFDASPATHLETELARLLDFPLCYARARESLAYGECDVLGFPSAPLVTAQALRPQIEGALRRFEATSQNFSRLFDRLRDERARSQTPGS